MDRSPQTWHVERVAPVRADAEGLFIPATDLSEAEVGDTVVVQGHEGGEQRTGTIAATSNRGSQRFFHLELHD